MYDFSLYPESSRQSSDKYLKREVSNRDSILVIQDYLVVPKPQDLSAPRGEYNWNKVAPDKGWFHTLSYTSIPFWRTEDSQVSRLTNFIQTLVSPFAKQHQAINFEHGFIKYKNNVTRVITNEFLFYTKLLLTIPDFQALQQGLMQFAKEWPQNLHLILASFAVKTDKYTYMNVVSYIECGQSPRLHLTVKNHPWVNDPKYWESETERQIRNTNVKEHDISYQNIQIDNRKHDFSFNNRILAKTAGNIPFYAFIDICYDYTKRITKDTLYQELDLAIKADRENEIPQLLSTPCTHILVSNIMPAETKYNIGEISHADPFYSYGYKDDVHFLNIDYIFGTPLNWIKIEPKSSHVIFGDVLADYYQQTLNNFINMEKFNQEVHAIKNRLYRYFNFTEYSHTETKAESAADMGKPSFLDSVLESMAAYASSVVEECPSYFPKNHSIASEYSPAFFSKPTVLSNDLATTFLPGSNTIALPSCCYTCHFNSSP